MRKFLRRWLGIDKITNTTIDDKLKLYVIGVMDAELEKREKAKIACIDFKMRKKFTEFIKGESFLDSIIERIKRKQL